MPTIREAVIASCEPCYCKVAMIVVRAADKLSDDSGAMLDSIASEITQLVSEGTLQATGDLSNWRGSEVRLAQD